MYKLVAIIGEAGSGKDYLVKQLVQNNPDLFHKIVPCTTRPQRDGEIDGETYHFISNNDFQDLASHDKILDQTCFKHWYYGSRIDLLDENKINIGVFNPTGIRQVLKRKSLIQIKLYRLKVDDKIRIIRQLEREESPDITEIARRFLADKEDFNNLDFKEEFSLSNNNFEDFYNNLKIIKKASQEDWDNKD